MKCKLQWSVNWERVLTTIITKVLSCNKVDEELEQSVAPPTSSHCCCLSALPTLTPGADRSTFTPGVDKFTPAPWWDPLVPRFNLGSTYTQCEDPIMETSSHMGHCGIPVYLDPLKVNVRIHFWRQIYTWANVGSACTRVLCEESSLRIHSYLYS